MGKSGWTFPRYPLDTWSSVLSILQTLLILHFRSFGYFIWIHWLGSPRTTVFLSISLWKLVRVWALVIWPTKTIYWVALVMDWNFYEYKLPCWVSLMISALGFSEISVGFSLFLSGSHGPGHILLLFLFFISFCWRYLLEVEYGWILFIHPLWEF